MKPLLAEQAVLAAALHVAGCADELVELLDASDFGDLRHRHIAKAIREALDAGQKVDPLTIAERMEGEGQLDAIGGLDYLAELTGVVAPPDHLRDHAGIIRRAALGRRLATACREAINGVHGDAGPVEALEVLERRLFSIDGPRGTAEPVTADEAAAEAWAVLEDAETRGDEALGLSWGLSDLDSIARLGPGELVLLAARPSMGKTALALQTVVSASRGAPVYLASLEMPARDIALRAIAAEAGLDLFALRRGRLTSGQRAEARAAYDAFRVLPLEIDHGDGGLTVQAIRARARRMARTKGLGLVVVDYLQLLAGGGEDNRNLEVSAISRGLKGLALELDVPVLALSQLNRSLETRSDKRPMLSDLRDSGSLEQDADLVAFVHRPERFLTLEEARSRGLEGVAELIVAKQRNGPTGSVIAHFSKASTRFMTRQRWGGAV